jgi:hypothetical protein
MNLATHFAGGRQRRLLRLAFKLLLLQTANQTPGYEPPKPPQVIFSCRDCRDHVKPTKKRPDGTWICPNNDAHTLRS